MEGCYVVCGGRAGVMEAACIGHREGRWDSKIVTIGILPDEFREGTNLYVEIAPPSDIGFNRNAIIARSASSAIAVAGGSGNLSEIVLACQFGRPIAVVIDSGGWAGCLAGMTLDSMQRDAVFATSSTREAVQFVLPVLRS
jgi:hypothetical protein